MGNDAPSNANTSGLAPCPFCGGSPSVRQAMGETWVVCGSCSASTQSKGRETVAFDLWNRRVTAASAQARIAELEALLEQAGRYQANFRSRATAAEARADRLAQELEWYGEQSRLARLIHREGDAGRNAIAADGGKRARAALQQETQK